jgi:hypothetical protein
MMVINPPFEKEPWEQRTLEINFAKQAAKLITDGYAWGTFTVKIYDSSDTDMDSTMQSGSASRTGNYLYFTVKGGTAGENYWARIRGTLTKALAQDQQIEGDLLIEVREAGK